MGNTQLQLRDGVIYYKWEDPVTPRLLFLSSKTDAERSPAWLS
jgi:hypothetical protein